MPVSTSLNPIAINHTIAITRRPQQPPQGEIPMTERETVHL
jgi:hypothetical protein